MATHQPLLENPKTSHCKTLYLILSIAAIVSSSAAVLVVATHLLKPISSDPLLHLPICDQADNQESCLAMVSEVVRDTNTIRQMDGVHQLQVFLKRSTSEIQKAMKTAKDVNHRINDPKVVAGLLDCVQLMDLSRDRILDSIVGLENITSRSLEDAHSWLSSVLTNHVTCLDGLHGSARTTMEPGLEDLISRARTSLAMLVAVSSPLKTKENIEPLNGKFPSWVTSRDRRLLQALAKELKANVVVAKDGSGNYKTVKEAVASAPNNGKTRYVIYVKKGKYKENVEVGKSKKNVMIVGDGMDSTIITGSLNVVDGSTTFKSATLGTHLSFYLFNYFNIYSFEIIIFTIKSFTNDINHVSHLKN
jgi:pectinesterase